MSSTTSCISAYERSGKLLMTCCPSCGGSLRLERFAVLGTDPSRPPTIEEQVKCNLCEDLIYTAEEWAALPLQEKKIVAGEEPETF
jgi:hypothetical protein